jgi:hypothetical protein
LLHDGSLDSLRPGTHNGILHQSHGGDLARPVADLTLGLKYRKNVLVKRDDTRRPCETDLRKRQYDETREWIHFFVSSASK